MKTDSRNVREGRLIPTSSYSDQPYIVKTDDGAWLCVVTTGSGHEGEPGQHVTSMRSTDRGETWSKPVPLEAVGGPEASYAVMLKVPGSGRVYCFYNHNTDNLREVKMEDGKTASRVDTLGYYVFKFSDDHGQSWSKQRYVIPVREFEYDRKNTYGGAVRFFWNVGRPVIHRGAALLTLHKVGAFGEGFLAMSEGVFLRSENLLTERDPAKITFETLPEGDVGLRAPVGGGRVAEEQCVTVLSDGTLFCVYRTVAGWPACARSFDGCRTWTEPVYMRYVPGSGTGGLFRKDTNPLNRKRRGARLSGKVKHPRAATFIWKCTNGKYLYWFHNHGGRLFRGDGTANAPKADPYEGRNPVWLAGGVERDTPQGKTIEWSEPEVLLYDDDVLIRMSYPDMIEEGGAYYFTETQKNFARTHVVDGALIEGLWRQFEHGPIAMPADVLVELKAPVPSESPMPRLPSFFERDYSRVDYGTKRTRDGFSITVEVKAEDQGLNRKRGELVLLDTMTSDGRGLSLSLRPEEERVVLSLSDGRAVSQWMSDHGSISAGVLNHIGVIVDGGPGVIMFVINGELCDGGDERQFGWGRLNPLMQHCNGSTTLRVTPEGGAAVASVRIYARALRVSELVVGQRG